MIKTELLNKCFDDVCALHNVNMHVPKGSVYGLIGPNGAGKTTLINILTGALSADRGSITINGEDIRGNDRIRQHILSIADDWYFYPSYTIAQTARFYKSMYKSFDQERYDSLTAMFKLDPKRQIRRLSKGVKKQVAFVMCLSCNPELMILDEPLDGLDPVVRKQILNIIISDVSERNMTVLVSSHNLRELEDICDYVGIIHKGEMLIEKPLDDLKGSVHKLQLAFNGAFPEEIKSEIEILHTSSVGSVYNLIVKGDIDKVLKKIQQYSPLVCDVVSLTLEEVFIYELGGMGYDFQSII